MPPAIASAPSNSGPVDAPVNTLTWNFWPWPGGRFIEKSEAALSEQMERG
jgi:hypothetical protein